MEEITACQNLMQRRINGWSKGLIEVQTNLKNLDETGPSLVKASSLHRTVRDFLQLGEINTMLSTMALPNYNASQTLAHAFTCEMKLGILQGIYGNTIINIMSLIKKADNTTGFGDAALVDEPECLCKTQSRMLLDHIGSFLEFAIRDDLVWYVKGKLDQQPELGGPQLLIAALAMLSHDASRSDTSMIRMVLGQGVRPNEYAHRQTPWQAWFQDYGLFSGREAVWFEIA